MGVNIHWAIFQCDISAMTLSKTQGISYQETCHFLTQRLQKDSMAFQIEQEFQWQFESAACSIGFSFPRAISSGNGVKVERATKDRASLQTQTDLCFSLHVPCTANHVYIQWEENINDWMQSDPSHCRRGNKKDTTQGSWSWGISVH